MNYQGTLDFLSSKLNLSLNGKLPIEIPNFGRVQLADLFRELNFEIGAEVGVERGEYSETICLANPEAKLFAIDGWQVYKGYRDHTNQQTMNQISEEAKKRLSKYNCEIVKKFSSEAVKDFNLESLDFVYIDASHEFSHVAHDLVEWAKRVRPGGIVSGHDYVRKKGGGYQCHVVDVLKAYTSAFNISPWFVLGTRAINEGEVRDRPRSWMFIKNNETVLRPHSF